MRIKQHKANTRTGLTDESKIAHNWWSGNHAKCWKEDGIIYRELNFYKKVFEVSLKKHS